MKVDLREPVEYAHRVGLDYVEIRTQRLFKTFLTTEEAPAAIGCTME